MLFGDTLDNIPITGLDKKKLITICAEGDNKCNGILWPLEDEMTRSGYVSAIVEFVKTTVG